MRIGIYLEYMPPTSGGGYTFQRDILEAFSKMQMESRHSFSLFVDVRNLKEINRNFQFQGINKIFYRIPRIVRLIGGMARRFNIFYLDKIGTIEQLAVKNRIEFLWFLTPAPYPVDIPYLTVVWDLQHRLQPWFPEVSYGMEWQNREVLNQSVLRRAAVVISGNEAGKKEIQEFYGINQERICLLPHPTPRFSLMQSSSNDQEVLNKHGIDEHCQYLFYPAQFWFHKNHVNLLLAVDLLKEKHNLPLSVVFVGSDKGNKRYIRGLVSKLDLEKQVFFLDFVPAEHLAALYRRAVALTYVTFFGPENLPPLEAFGLGCPVIASEVPGAREQLGEAAIYINPKDPESIASAIKVVCQDPELRKELISKGKARAQCWTSKDFVRGVFGILDDFEAVRRCWDTPGGQVR